MFFMQVKTLAGLILKLSPIVLDASQLIRKWRRKEGPAPEDLPARIERLEKNLELQSKLNEEFLAEMQILKPALEGIQRSIRLLFFFALLACSLALLSVLLMFLR